MDEQEKSLPNSTLQGELLTAPKYLARILKSQQQELDSELSPLTKLSLSELDIAGGGRRGKGFKKFRQQFRKHRRRREMFPPTPPPEEPPSPPQEEDPFDPCS
ncbi:MAG: hypothetical protein F6K41_18225 [Symploca sp. SIO3E6]|nr:hypothetical protein [Caldora sp. SIO3E6]